MGRYVLERLDQRIRQHVIDGRQRQHMVAERIEDMPGDYLLRPLNGQLVLESENPGRQ